jgi:hypothetical protein
MAEPGLAGHRTPVLAGWRSTSSFRALAPAMSGPGYYGCQYCYRLKAARVSNAWRPFSWLQLTGGFK